MSEEVDRKIAELVMGEEEPKEYPMHDLDRRSKGGNWQYVGEEWRWEPMPFSTDLKHTLTAFEHYVEEWKARYRSWRDFPHSAVLHVYWDFSGEGSKLPCRAYFGSGYALGRTFEEAICNLLLALKEREKA